MNHDVIIALDFPSAQDVYSFLDQFKDEKPFVKKSLRFCTQVK